MSSWDEVMGNWDKAHEELLSRPLESETLPFDPRNALDEIKIRLDKLSLYEPIVAHCRSWRDWNVRFGRYDITREDLYAWIAFEALKAKHRYERMALELVHTRPSPFVIFKDKTTEKESA